MLLLVQKWWQIKVIKITSAISKSKNRNFNSRNPVCVGLSHRAFRLSKLAICARNFEQLAIGKLFSEEPNQQIEEDLQRFKRLIETGSIMKIERQPSGIQKEQSKTKAMKVSLLNFGFCRNSCLKRPATYSNATNSNPYN